MEQQRVKEKQAIKQREEEEEMRWIQRQGHNPEQLSAQIERPWTISALSIPEHVAVCEYPPDVLPGHARPRAVVMAKAMHAERKKGKHAAILSDILLRLFVVVKHGCIVSSGAGQTRASA